MLFLLRIIIPRLFIWWLVLIMIYAVYIYAIRNKEKMTNCYNLSKADIEKYIKLRIQLFTKNDCQYCTKMVEKLGRANLLTNTQIIDINTPDGKTQFNQTGEIGVPCFRSGLTGKIKCGYTEDLFALIKDLS